MMNKQPTLAEIQSMWKVPTVAHFFKIFQKYMELDHFDIEELEDSLMKNQTNEDDDFLVELLTHLLMGYFNCKINEDNLAVRLNEAIEDWCENEKFQNPLKDSSFSDLPAESKVEVIFILCHLWLESNDCTDITKEMNVKDMKALCIGTDRNKAQYWHFHDTRIYKENPKAAKSKKSQIQQERKVKSARVNAKKENLNPLNNTKESSENEQWQLICRTEQDWNDFANKMLKSDNKDEKQIGIQVNRLLVDSVKAAFQLKEKEYRRKLLEMTAKRESKRIAIKRQIGKELKAKEFEQAEKKRKVEEAMKDKHRQLQEEKDRERRANERQKRILNRQKIVQDRALRVAMRQQRAEQMSNCSYSDESNTDDDDDFEDDILLKENLEKLVSDLMVQGDSWLFLERVDESYAPNYYSIIKKPMCLNDIKEKLNSGSCSKFEAVERDFCQMLINCYLYNGYESDCGKMADRLQRVFRNRCKRFKFPMTFASSARGIELAVKNLRKEESNNKTSSIQSDTIDLPDSQLSDHVSESESSSPFSADAESSSDYDEFNSILAKRPKPNPKPDTSIPVTNPKAPMETATEVNTTTTAPNMSPSNSTWSYRAAAKQSNTSSALLPLNTQIVKNGPLDSAQLNSDSSKIVKLGDFVAKSGFTYSVKSMGKNENGVLTLKLLQKPENSINGTS